MIRYRIWGIIGLCWWVWLLTGCTTAVPAQAAQAATPIPITPNPLLLSTVQADQYWRDAQATTQARQAEQAAMTATFESDLRNVQTTAVASQLTSEAAMAEATATAHVQQTRDALVVALTAGAATSEAQATSTRQSEVAIAAAGTAVMEATSQAFVATRQSLELQNVQAQVSRQQTTQTVILSVGILAALIILALGGWFGMGVV